MGFSLSQLPLAVFKYLFIWRGVCVCVSVCLGRRGNFYSIFVHLSFFSLMSPWMGFERLDVDGNVGLFPEGETHRALSLEHPGGGPEALQTKGS